MVAMLISCGLRRADLLGLGLESIQQREAHWVIADLWVPFGSPEASLRSN
jgi:integrase